MSNAKIISVDPGIKTLGELNINEINLTRLSRTISNPGRKSTFKNTLNMVFGINSRTDAGISSKMFGLRLIGGTLMTALGALSLSGSAMVALPHMLTVACLAFGISLLTGSFTRLISMATACIALFTAYTAFSAGSLDTVSLMTAMLGIGACVIGPGHYSADSLMRRQIFRLYRNAHRYDPERNADNLMFDYNAFAAVERRIG